MERGREVSFSNQIHNSWGPTSRQRGFDLPRCSVTVELFLHRQGHIQSFRVQVGADKVTKQLIGDPQTRNHIVKSCPYADYAWKFYNETEEDAVNWLNSVASSTHTFNRPFSGLPGWAGTRKVKAIWILLKQQTVSGSGISWAIGKSAPRSRQITMPAPYHSVCYRPDALPAAQPTVSKHCRQKQWKHMWHLIIKITNTTTYQAKLLSLSSYEPVIPPNTAGCARLRRLATAWGLEDICTCTDTCTLLSIYLLQVAEWLACWTQAQKGQGSNRSRDAVG